MWRRFCWKHFNCFVVPVLVGIVDDASFLKFLPFDYSSLSLSISGGCCIHVTLKITIHEVGLKVQNKKKKERLGGRKEEEEGEEKGDKSPRYNQARSDKRSTTCAPCNSVFASFLPKLAFRLIHFCSPFYSQINLKQ